MVRPAVLLLTVVALILSGCDGDERDDRAVALGAERPSFDRAGWRTDFSRTIVPLEEIHVGGPPRDGVPPIDRPRAVVPARAERFLTEREPVLVVEQGEAARAYPLRTLVWHEIVNDRLAGRALAVTYSPLTSSPRVFDRRVGGRELTFGTTGNLRRSNGVMWDRGGESWWQQLTGQAIVGARAGERLRPVAAQTLSWAQFKRRYPRGDVLSRDTGAERDYSTNPYLGYDDPASRPHLFRGRVDGRLLPKERVVAVLEGRAPLVVPFARLRREPLIQLDAERVAAVVLHQRGVASPIDADSIARSEDVGTATAFDRRVRGRALTFVRRGRSFADRETGSSWDVSGRAIAGPLRGERLRPLRQIEAFWFALAAFAPQAQVATRP